MNLALTLAVVLANALPAETAVQRDVPYGDDPAQRFDVYSLPRAHGAPVMVMVHGGGWTLGDKANESVVANKASRWLPKGFIFVSVNYRLLPGAKARVQAQDVAKAIAKIQSLAASWGGDPARLVLMGHSSGAHLVALVASSPSLQTDLKPWLGTIMLDSAALDVESVMSAPHPSFFDSAFGSDPAGWRASSPLAQLAQKGAPMLAVCSSRRGNSCPNARAFVERAESLGTRASVLPVAMSHGEINRDLGLQSDYTAQVEEFLRTLKVMP